MSIVPSKLVEYEETDDGARIMLARPERLNAVNEDLLLALLESLRRAQESNVRVAVLGGRGRAFCAGFDLKQEERERDILSLRSEMSLLQDVTRSIRRCPFPIIAMVQGYAVGAGLEFALACDLVVAADDAQFRFPEVSMSLTITGGVSYLLPLIVGPAKAKELVFFSGGFTAIEGLEMGLVNRVVALESLGSSVDAWALELSSQSQIAVQLAKAAIDEGSPGDIAKAYEIELAHAVIAQTAPGANEAQQAFASRRSRPSG